MSDARDMNAPGRAAPLGAALALALVGCGQKGALYLPEKGHTVVTSPAPAPQTAPAPAAPTQPSPGTPEQSPQGAAPQPPESAPAQATPPPKKSDKDNDSQSPQSPLSPQ